MSFLIVALVGFVIAGPVGALVGLGGYVVVILFAMAIDLLGGS